MIVVRRQEGTQTESCVQSRVVPPIPVQLRRSLSAGPIRWRLRRRSNEEAAGIKKHHFRDLPLLARGDTTQPLTGYRLTGSAQDARPRGFSLVSTSSPTWDDQRYIQVSAAVILAAAEGTSGFALEFAGGQRLYVAATLAFDISSLLGNSPERSR